MKDISDKQVVEAVRDAKLTIETEDFIWPYELLSKRTGQCEKVCFRCLERCNERGYLEYGVSVRTSWVTEKGCHLIGEKYDTAPVCTVMEIQSILNKL